MVRMRVPVLDYALHTSRPVPRPRKHARDTASALLACALFFVAVACGEGNGTAACLPQDVIRCTCADGSQGFAVCDVDAGAGYGVCTCDGGGSPYLPEAGTAVLDAGADADGGLQFMSPCNPADDQCPAGTSCDAFPSKGPHCSKPCKQNSDCPAPSPGCNMMGVCKTP